MRRLAVLLIPLLILSFAIGGIACESDEDKAPIPEAAISEPPIPAHFSTYTSEDLFSISYPPDWTPATSIIGELWEEIKEEMESTDPEFSLQDASMLFVGGKPSEEGYYPNVNIIVSPRSVGYWTLDEVVEGEDAYSRMNVRGYKVFSELRTTVGGREAAITDLTSDEPGYGKWRYILLLMVKDKFAWLVACGAEFDDFEVYEGTFNDVVRSFRILQ